MRKITLEQRSGWHEQWILYMVARQAPQGGFDYAQMEANGRLVSLFKKDRNGALIEPQMNGQNTATVPFLTEIMLEDADWSALVGKFKAHRWAVHDDEILALGAKLINAQEYKVEDSHAARQHIQRAAPRSAAGV